MTLSGLGDWFKKAVDQVNPLDNGKSFKNQNPSAQAGQRTIEAANQNLQGAKYGVLANPQTRQAFQNYQSHGNSFNPFTAAQGAFNQGVTDIGRGIGGALVNTGQAPYSALRLASANITGNNAARQNALRAAGSDFGNNLFYNDAYKKAADVTGGAIYANRFAHNQHKANQNLTDTIANAYGTPGAKQWADNAVSAMDNQDLNRYLNQYGIDQNSSKLKVAARTGLPIVNAGAQLALTAGGIGAGAKAAESLIANQTGRQILNQLGSQGNKIGLTNASLGVVSALGEGAKPTDVVKAGLQGYETGFIMPFAGYAGGKAISPALGRAHTPEELAQRNELVNQYNKAIDKNKPAIAERVAQQIDALDNQTKSPIAQALDKRIGTVRADGEFPLGKNPIDPTAKPSTNLERNQVSSSKDSVPEQKGVIIKETKPQPDGSKIVIRARRNPETGKLDTYQERVAKNTDSTDLASLYGTEPSTDSLQVGQFQKLQGSEPRQGSLKVSSSTKNNTRLQAQTEMHDMINSGGNVEEAMNHYMERTGGSFGEAQLALQKLFNSKSIDKKSVNSSLNPEYGTVKESAITKGDATQPILNSKAIRESVASKGAGALNSIQKLSMRDQQLLDSLRTTNPAELSKSAENPKAFLEAANKVKGYNDFTQAAGAGLLGQQVPYRQNYGAPLLLDTSTPEAVAALDAAKAKLKNAPGYGKQRTFRDYNDAAQYGVNRLNKSFAEDLQQDIQRRSNDLGQLSLAKGLHEAFPGQVKIGEIGFDPNGGTYKQLQIAGGNKISMPAEIADQINKRAGGLPAEGALKLYDKANAGLKYIKLGGGAFHALTEAGNFIGQQLTSRKFFTEPGSTGKVFKTFFSDGAMQKELSSMQEKGTLDKARLSGLTTSPTEIKADVNITPAGKLAKYSGIKAIHDATFQREIPYAKLKLFEQKTEGLDINNPADVLKMRETAKGVNELFGGINRAVEGITPQNAKRWSRILLASDFTESKIRTMVNAISKGGPGGTIAREAVAGKVLLFAGLAAAGGALGGEYNGKDSKTITQEVAGKLLDPSFDFGSYKVSLPATHVSEFTKPFKSFLPGQGDNKFYGLEHYGTSRLAAIPSEALQLIDNRDYTGNHLYGKQTKKQGGEPISAPKAALNIAGGLLPIPGAQGISVATGQQNVPAAIANTIGLRAYQPDAPTPKTANQDVNDTVKAAFNSPEGKKFIKLTDAQKKAAANSDPAMRDLYNQYKAMKTGLSSPDLPNELSDSSKKAITQWEHLTPAAKDKIQKSDPGRYTAYRLADVERQILNGEISKEDGIKKWQTIQQQAYKASQPKPVKVAKAKSTGGRKSGGKTKVNIGRAFSIATDVPLKQIKVSTKAPKVDSAKLKSRTYKVAKKSPVKITAKKIA